MEWVKMGRGCLCTYLLSYACVCMSLHRSPRGESKSLAKLSAFPEESPFPRGRDQEMETWYCTFVF